MNLNLQRVHSFEVHSSEKGKTTRAGERTEVCRTNALRRNLLFLACLALVASLATGCGQSLSGDPEVPKAVSMGDETLLWGPEIKAQALAIIRASTVYCHLTMYELSDPDILNALAEAERRGVQVKVIVDAKEPHSQSIAVPYLRAHGVIVRELRIPGGISHIKSLVAQTKHGLEALLGGMNFGAYSWENHDASVYFAHARSEFEGLFQEDYARAGGEPELQTYFSPPLLYDSQIEPAILHAVSEARRDIVIDAFAFTSRPLIAALGAAVARGVTVRVLLDKKESYNRETARKLARAGVHVRFYSPYRGEYLHAKIVSIDGGQVVFVGSANFSYHGFNVNHEGDVEFFDAGPFAMSIDRDLSHQFKRGEPLYSF